MKTFHTKPVVLKFGSSVLRGPSDLPQVVTEIYRYRRTGRPVVAILSAFEGVTDALLERAGVLCSDPLPRDLVPFVASGEAESCLQLSLALRAAGLSASVFGARDVPLEVCGDPLDAEPVRFDASALVPALEQEGVVLLPGFTGLSRTGELCLLGRGGSDLTALACAVAFDTEARLLKDVDGLFEWDPARGGNPRLYRSITYARALALGGDIVQRKAIEFARERKVCFEVARVAATQGTRVGSGETTLESCTLDEQGVQGETVRAPLRVSLLGLGTVGSAVQARLARDPERFEIVSACVRDLTRERALAFPRERLCGSVKEALAARPDIVVELIGGERAGFEAIRDALAIGVSVVTGNKDALASFGEELHGYAAAQGASLRASAAVGGGMPAIESVRAFAQRSPIRSLRGVLNGTTNYILDRLAAGLTFESALAEAQELGFAEASPERDLDGRDAAAKLEILVREAFPGSSVPARGSLRIGPRPR